MIPQADSDAREFYGPLDDVRAERLRRKKYPRLKQIDVDALCRRVADYLARRRAADEELDELERKLGRPLRFVEESRIVGQLNKERKKLLSDLRYCSAGFEGGSGQFFSIAGESNVLIDEITGWLPPEYHDLARKMSPLPKSERYQLIDGLFEKGEIDGRQRDELVRLFINNLPDESTCDISFKGDPIMGETINPDFCPFRYKRPDGSVMCEYRSEDYQDDENIMADENDGLNGDYPENNDISVTDDDILHEDTSDDESINTDDTGDSFDSQEQW